MKKTRTALSVFAAALMVGMSGASLPAAAATASAGNVTVNVTSFGANGSDRKSDSAAIQKALNKAKTTKGTLTVRIPKGTYYFTDKLVVYSNTHIKLDQGAVIRRSVDDYFFVSYEEKYRDINNNYDNIGSVTIEGGKFCGGSYEKGAFNFWNANNITFKDIAFSGIAGSADSSHVLLMNGVDGLKVTNCSFINCCTTKDHINSEAVHIDYIPEGFQGAVKDIPCKNVSVTGCTFSSVSSGIGTHHTNPKSASNIKIQNNTFRNVKYACVNAYSFNKLYIYSNNASNVGSLVRGVSGVNHYIRNNTVKLRSGAIYRIGRKYYDLYGIMEEGTRNIRMSNNKGITIGNYEFSGCTNLYLDGKKMGEDDFYPYRSANSYSFRPIFG